MEPISNDLRLWETLKPLYFQLEICKKPASLSRASGFLTKFMLMPQTAPRSPRAPSGVSSALMSTSYLLHWKPLGVLLQPEAREHWLCGLEKDTEYLIRMRVRNRNGFSGYSVPNLSGVFTTSDGGRRHSLSSLQRFFGTIKEGPPMEAIALSFIGNLYFELLEARDLPRADPSFVSAKLTNLSCVNKAEEVQHGCYYAVVSIETPSTPHVERSGNSCNDTRLIYCVRSPLATLQQDMILSGTSKAWRHPRFALSTVFRAPESLAHSPVTISVNCEIQGQIDSYCVGRISLSLLDLVQGMPAKMQWLPLVNVFDPNLDGGLVLLRTLFLPNGVSVLPHPTLPNTWGTTAEELLSTLQEVSTTPGRGNDCGSPPRSSSSTASTSSISSSSSQFSTSSKFTDSLGFGVFDPEIQLRHGEWQRIKQESGAARCYVYYKLLVKALEQQQDARWRSVLVGNINPLQQIAKGTDSCVSLCKAVHVTTDIAVCVLDAKQKHEIRELVWKGIPISRRPELYSQMSGASIIQTHYPRDYFLSLRKRLVDPTDEVHSRPKSSRFMTAKKQIEVDLKRTFGNDECWLTSSIGQTSMEHVLLAYALHNDDLGYCQSMTFVVGRLLCLYHSQMRSDKSEKTIKIPTEEEERVFWLLHVICEDLFPSYYTQGMTGVQVDGGVLDKLIRTRLPKLHRHFQKLHAPPMGLVLATQWLLPLCCAVFPSETCFRFLDVLFYEGSSVVFAMAVALLRISQHDMLTENVDYTQLFRFLRARDQRLHDTPLLMEIACEEHQLHGAQADLLRKNVARELGIHQDEHASKRASTTKLLRFAVDELRPGDVDTNI
ncbi:RabGAP/TBC domain-containing hypothetical protein [Phytophthora megakarya]|uniref:Rab-GAP TBC domain-containing protein n=1 Tax=Phytophthora megakarya TaxID=4795 RepID=A0A225WRE2_9STRA|nr:RabGAP/TBC domain-containing hypothetical protein [Phytophthora megakarya]